MSSVNSINNGKAVVKEEVSSPTAVDGAPPTMFLLPVTQETNAHHHQALLDSSGRHDRLSNGQGHPWSSVHDLGTSSLPPSLPAPAAATAMVSRPVGFRAVMQHCVAALDAGDIVAVNADLQAMSYLALASANGEPTQRAAFAFAEALGRRALQTLPGLSWGLQYQLAEQVAPAHADAARRCFDVLCPFLRVAALAANQTIVTALEGEKHVHVVDLGGGAAASPDQWLDLLRLFAARPEGAPVLHLSVVSEQEALLSRTAGLLSQEAVRLHVPFIFNPVRSRIDQFSAPDITALVVHSGEALVITSTLQLHRLIADEVSIGLPAGAGDHHGSKGKRKKADQRTAGPHLITRADALLRDLCDLSPKLVVLTEQEADHNGASLWDRASNAFDYYAALFSDLEAGGGAPRDSADRAAVERLLLREEIMDIVAREGASRRERHESMKSWARWMGAAGFKPAPVVTYDESADARLAALQLAADGTLRYWVAKKDAYAIVYSRMTPVLAVTAWRPARKVTRRLVVDH